MNYCIGVMLEEGMVFASDSRAHAGVDNFAKFCKMTAFERPGDRVVVLLSSGNLAGTQAVIGVLNQRCDAGDAVPNLWNARTMFDVAMLVASTVSRLVVDLNRSMHHPRCLSGVTRRASRAPRAEIVERHYLPYRAAVERLVGRSVSRGGRVIHVSSHSFAPELDGGVRMAAFGLLYDPGRHAEVDLCARWKVSLVAMAPQLRVRRNYPYAGKGDGLTRYLRMHFPLGAYVGIELEVNQGIAFAAGRRWTKLRRVLIDSLRAAVGRASEGKRSPGER